MHSMLTWKSCLVHELKNEPKQMQVAQGHVISPCISYVQRITLNKTLVVR